MSDGFCGKGDKVNRLELLRPGNRAITECQD